jgi:hypothetical protein
MSIRELDAWIAEHVMGWKWMRFDAPAAAVNSGKKRDKWCQLVPPFEKWYQQPQLNGVICNCAIEGMPDWTDLSVFKPSTDPAAAMQVLEKCAENGVLNGEFKLPVSIFRRGDLQWVVSENTEDEEESIDRTYIVVEAPTLPLAICLFAKELFK